MRRAVTLTLALLSTAVLESGCTTVNTQVRCVACRKFDVPPTKSVDEFTLNVDKPGFLFVRFLNDHGKDQSHVVLVLVDLDGTRILSVVGPLKENASYSKFYTKLYNGSALLCPGGYFCPKGDCRVPSPLGEWPPKPRESPGPPPPFTGSIITQDVASGSLADDANAAANAAVETVQAATH